ncbi:AGE family epimerase/isomerase [Shivajiella indica]|uniref:AGE family epimerase/isomerase n=1 Tax=Shivajiella indica TaxID=872115 RepID=A0ABW5B7U0_9BACT
MKIDGSFMFLGKMLLFSLIFCCLSCQNSSTNEIENQEFLAPEYWKNQVLQDVIPYWTRSIVDSANNSFYTTLDENWQANSDSVRFPSMIARHLFSYASAYLLSGEEEHLVMADKLYDYLIRYSWDGEYGGWFNSLNPDGLPLDVNKSTFVQVYVITGLAMYYFVTKDDEVYDFIQSSNSILEEKVWDSSKGGYFDNLNRDWSLQNNVKSFSSQLAPVSGYLNYLYLATRDVQYLHQMERILDTCLENMLDNENGWILESFDQDWNYMVQRTDENEINVGHNIELAWMLVRAYLLNGNAEYLSSAKALSDSSHRYGFNDKSGIWYGGIGNTNPEKQSDFTYWWIQAYGLMFDLCLTSLSEKEPYVQSFLKGADFWENYFMDRVKGDSHLAVSETGEVKMGVKANQFKASYHNVEHGMLNYLYLSAWVNPQPVTLYFRIKNSPEGEILYPLPIESMDYTIKEVKINGKAFAFQMGPENGISLPQINASKVSVEIGF